MTEQKRITASTIARTICLVLALINQGLTIAGHSPLPIENETVVQIVSLTATVVTSLIAWWKNNSFTQAALTGDEVMRTYKEK